MTEVGVQIIVSVPLRGNGCETYFADEKDDAVTITVSVPLRGNGCETKWITQYSIYTIS